VFGPRYFGVRYFGPRYFGPGAPVVVVEVTRGKGRAKVTVRDFPRLELGVRRAIIRNVKLEVPEVYIPQDSPPGPLVYIPALPAEMDSLRRRTDDAPEAPPRRVQIGNITFLVPEDPEELAIAMFLLTEEE
jgi:hypothetical protein